MYGHEFTNRGVSHALRHLMSYMEIDHYQDSYTANSTVSYLTELVGTYRPIQ